MIELSAIRKTYRLGGTNIHALDGIVRRDSCRDAFASRSSYRCCRRLERI